MGLSLNLTTSCLMLLSAAWVKAQKAPNQIYRGHRPGVKANTMGCWNRDRKMFRQLGNRIKRGECKTLPFARVGGGYDKQTLGEIGVKSSDLYVKRRAGSRCARLREKSLRTLRGPVHLAPCRPGHEERFQEKDVHLGEAEGSCRGC